MIVGFRFFSAYFIIAKNIAHTPHKLFLFIVGPDVNRNSKLAEVALEVIWQTFGPELDPMAETSVRSVLLPTISSTEVVPL